MLVNLNISTKRGDFEGKDAELTDEEFKNFKEFVKELAARGTYFEFKSKEDTIIILSKKLLQSAVYTFVIR